MKESSYKNVVSYVMGSVSYHSFGTLSGTVLCSLLHDLITEMLKIHSYADQTTVKCTINGKRR